MCGGVSKPILATVFVGLFAIPVSALAQPTVSIGLGVTFLNIERKNVVAIHGSVKVQFCPQVALVGEFGQGIVGWRAGEIRFTGLSAIVCVAESPRIHWYVGFGMGDYQCPCVGEDVYGCILAGLRSHVNTEAFGEFPVLLTMKIAWDRGFWRSSNLSFLLSATPYPLSWSPAGG